MPTVTTLSGSTIAIKYTIRDFESYRSDILSAGGLADTYTPNWTDRSELDLGVALIEGVCFLADNLAFYQDRCVNEALFPSAVQRRSIIEHCKLLGYELHPNTSASVELTFETTDSGTVPSGTQISVDTSDGSEPSVFELESDFISTGSGTYPGIIALHGTTIYNESLGDSDSTPGQSYILQQYPLTVNPSGTSSLQVFVNDGVPTEWAEVDNFLESSSTDEVFRSEIDEYDKITVIFGDGVNGKIPPSGAGITTTYRTGGGSSGNEVGPNKLTQISGNFPFVLSVTNPATPSGGQDKESIEEAKINAPLTFKAMNRAVTHEDYRYLAKLVPGVSEAYAYQGTGVYEENVVISAGGSNPVPTGTWDPQTASGTGLLGAVGDYLEARKTTPVILNVLPANPVDIILNVVVYCNDNARRSSVERLVQDTVIEALSADNQEFGKTVPLSYVYDIVESLSGVDYLDILQFQREPWARQKTGISSLVFGSMIYGVETNRERWRIDFTTATTFTLTGSTYGLQSNTGTIGSPYLIDDGSFGFTVTGTTSAGEVWEILVGPYVGNILPDKDEICRLKDSTFSITVQGGIG